MKTTVNWEDGRTYPLRKGRYIVVTYDEEADDLFYTTASFDGSTWLLPSTMPIFAWAKMPWKWNGKKIIGKSWKGAGR